jgi:hypothetical protein
MRGGGVAMWLIEGEILGAEGRKGGRPEGRKA